MICVADWLISAGLPGSGKTSDNSTEFYFLGEMHPTGTFEQIVMADGKTNAVEILYELEEPVRPDLYDYFLSSFNE